MVDQKELKDVLSGPHKYVNGHYVSALPTQEEINAAENTKAEERAKAEEEAKHKTPLLMRK